MIIGTRRRPVLAATALAIAMLLTGCAGAAGPAGPAGGEPVRGGTAVIGTPVDPGCIDPHQLQQRAMLSITRQVTDSLVHQDTDTGRIEPWLAEWTVGPDGRSYTFDLRDDVTFSDGTPLTAEVVKGNIDAVLEMGARAIVAGPYLRNVQEVTVDAPDRVTIALAEPDAQLLQGLSTPSLGIVGAATLAGSPDDRCRGGIVGTGPFTLTDFVSGQRVELARRDGYAWAPAAFANQGEAHLDTVEFRQFPDASVRLGSLLSNQIDLTVEMQPQDIAQAEAAGMTPVLRPNPGFTNSLFVNADRAPLDDPAIREALQVGFDRAVVVPTALDVTDIPSTAVLSSTTPMYTDMADRLGFDAARATQALDEAGWVPGPDGVRVRDGQRASFDVMYFTPIYLLYVPLLELMRQQYGEIGIEMNLEPVPLAVGTERQRNLDFDARMSGLTRADPGVLESQIYRGDDELNAVLTAQRQATDEDRRQELVDEASGMILDRGYNIPIHELILPMAANPRVQGVELDATNGLLLSGLWRAG
ncbi:ABC transporter substrate-binding protein [Pseudonocardia kongjuensis]|uniref:ABC transporter substrate-binding protein n=1 Tax=Pseudonocardia kongjuensis TaxID=102227 RepID=A0ABP4I7H0_9PSEU